MPGMDRSVTYYGLIGANLLRPELLSPPTPVYLVHPNPKEDILEFRMTRTMKMPGAYVIALLLLLLGIVASFIFLRITSQGLWLTDDSILYVIGADGMLAGRGFTRLSGGGEIKPITGFPPGYSALLTAAGLAGVDFYSAARLINAFLFGGTIFLAGLLVYHDSNSGIMALLASLLLASARVMTFIYGWLMAEGLFIFIFLCTLFALQRFFLDRRPIWLASAALIAGLNVLVRYAALAFIPALGLGLFLWRMNEWRKGLRSAVAFVLIALVPFLLVTLGNVLAAGTAVNRTVLIGGIDGRTLVVYMERLFGLLVPFQGGQGLRLRYKAVILLITLGVLPAAQILQAMRARLSSAANPAERPPRGSLPLLAGIAMGAYLPAVWLTTAYLIGGGVHVDRYLIPVFVGSVLVVAASIAHHLSCFRLRPWGSGLVLLAWVPLLLGHASQTASFIRTSIPPFAEYSHVQKYADVVDAVEGIEPGRVIYCNEIYRLYFLTGRYAYQIPIFYDAYKQAAREDFDVQLARFRERMREGAVLLLFDSYDHQQPRFPPREVLVEDFQISHELETAIIYAWE